MALPLEMHLCYTYTTFLKVELVYLTLLFYAGLCAYWLKLFALLILALKRFLQSVTAGLATVTSFEHLCSLIHRWKYRYRRHDLFALLCTAGQPPFHAFYTWRAIQDKMTWLTGQRSKIKEKSRNCHATERITFSTWWSFSSQGRTGTRFRSRAVYDMKGLKG